MEEHGEGGRRIQNRIRLIALSSMTLVLLSAALPSPLLYDLAFSQAQERNAPAGGESPARSLPTTERVMNLTLEQAIRLALLRNLEVKRDRLLPRIARTDVEEAKSEFDPVVNLAANLAKTETLPEFQIESVDPDTGKPLDPIIIKSSSKDGEVTPSLQQTIRFGGSYELSFTNTRSDIDPSSGRIVNPRYVSKLELSFSQPLLRDFGIKVNTSTIRQAQKAVEIADQQTRQTILDTIFAVQQRYWMLVSSRTDLQTEREALTQAKDFLADNRERVKFNVLAPIELVQSEAQIKFRQGSVIDAEAQVEDAEDQLKEVLNISKTVKDWQIRIRPTDTPPFVPMKELSVASSVEYALANRPDYLQSQLEIASLQIAQAFAKNQLLPRLDIVMGGNFSAYGGSIDQAWGNLDRLDGYQWFIGLQAQYPTSNRFARSRLQRRNLELKQALYSRDIIKRTIILQLRQAVRNIKTAGQQVEVTRAGTALAKAQLEAEHEKFRAGLSTSFRILAFQDDLREARLRETKALTTYNIALAALDLLTGTLSFGDVTARLRLPRR